MSCNCGKNRSQLPVTSYAVTPRTRREPVMHRLTRADGSHEDFPTKLAAFTANIKEGNGGVVTAIEDADAAPERP